VSYVIESSWKCMHCGQVTEFKYAGANPEFCSNVCKFRWRDERWQIEKLIADLSRKFPGTKLADKMLSLWDSRRKSEKR